jgi:hypothetical protein
LQVQQLLGAGVPVVIYYNGPFAHNHMVATLAAYVPPLRTPPSGTETAHSRPSHPVVWASHEP